MMGMRAMPPLTEELWRDVAQAFRDADKNIIEQLHQLDARKAEDLARIAEANKALDERDAALKAKAAELETNERRFAEEKRSAEAQLAEAQRNLKRGEDALAAARATMQRAMNTALAA